MNDLKRRIKEAKARERRRWIEHEKWSRSNQGIDPTPGKSPGSRIALPLFGLAIGLWIGSFYYMRFKKRMRAQRDSNLKQEVDKYEDSQVENSGATSSEYTGSFKPPYSIYNQSSEQKTFDPELISDDGKRW